MLRRRGGTLPAFFMTLKWSHKKQLSGTTWHVLYILDSRPPWKEETGSATQLWKKARRVRKVASDLRPCFPASDGKQGDSSASAELVFAHLTRVVFPGRMEKINPSVHKKANIVCHASDNAVPRVVRTKCLSKIYALQSKRRVAI